MAERARLLRQKMKKELKKKEDEEKKIIEEKKKEEEKKYGKPNTWSRRKSYKTRT